MAASLGRRPFWRLRQPRYGHALIGLAASAWVLCYRCVTQSAFTGGAACQSSAKRPARLPSHASVLGAQNRLVMQAQGLEEMDDQLSDPTAEIALLRQEMQELVQEMRLLREVLQNNGPADEGHGTVEVHAKRSTPRQGPVAAASGVVSTFPTAPPPAPAAPPEIPAPRPLEDAAEASAVAVFPDVSSAGIEPTASVFAGDPGLLEWGGRFSAVEQELTGKVFAWCHNGEDKTGEICFEGEGKTGLLAPSWQLPRWRVVAPNEVVLEDFDGSNAHHLTFNIAFTGFYCDQAGQRGFVEGSGFSSPDMAAAPDAPAATGGEQRRRQQQQQTLSTSYPQSYGAQKAASASESPAATPRQRKAPSAKTGLTYSQVLEEQQQGGEANEDKAEMLRKLQQRIRAKRSG